MLYGVLPSHGVEMWLWNVVVVIYECMLVYVGMGAVFPSPSHRTVATLTSVVMASWCVVALPFVGVYGLASFLGALGLFLYSILTLAYVRRLSRAG